jgi:hypothetical protein
VIRLCDRFHKLPSEIMREPVEMLRMIALEGEMRTETPARPEPPPDIIGYTLGGEPIERQTNRGPAAAPAE